MVSSSESRILHHHHDPSSAMYTKIIIISHTCTMARGPSVHTTILLCSARQLHLRQQTHPQHQLPECRASARNATLQDQHENFGARQGFKIVPPVSHNPLSRQLGSLGPGEARLHVSLHHSMLFFACWQLPPPKKRKNNLMYKHKALAASSLAREAHVDENCHVLPTRLRRRKVYVAVITARALRGRL